MADEQLPDPLTPADCDLRDFQYMELDVRRLRDSKFASTPNGDAFRAGVLLWCAAWQQVPAASLPDDDVELANLAGYGRMPFSVREWRKIRTEALNGFVKCSDGRLYHEVVAEKANAAWLSRLEYAYEKIKDRVRKENKQRVEHGQEPRPIPPLDWWLSNGRPTEFPMDAAGIPAENALRGKGRGNGKGEGDVQGNTAPAAPTPSPSPSPSPSPTPAPAPTPAPTPSPSPAPAKTRRAEDLVEHDALLAEGLTPETATAWLAHRKRKKAPLSVLAWRGFKAEADRAKWPYEQAVLKAIARNWVGFEAKWVQDEPRPGHTAPAGETAYQRSQRELVEQATGGLVSRRRPSTKPEVIDAQPSSLALD